MHILSPQDLEEFRQIWFKEFDESLDPDKVEAIAERFLSAIHPIVTLSDRADRKAENAKDIEEGTVPPAPPHSAT